jgi:4-oxalocrotonate tautomerase
MPYLNVKICGQQSPEVTSKVASFLTELTASVLGKKKELTSVAVEYLSPGQWFIGGTSLSSQGLATFYLDIKVTEGTNTKNEKASYAHKVFAEFEAVLGGLNPASYIVIHEVRADSWGYAGETQEFRYIKGRSL